jgi:hypothetical protein
VKVPLFIGCATHEGRTLSLANEIAGIDTDEEFANLVSSLGPKGDSLNTLQGLYPPAPNSGNPLPSAVQIPGPGPQYN